MTVPEAAIKILQEYPDGLSAKKVTDEILAHKFFESMILQQKRIQTPKHDFMVTCASPSR